MGFPERVLDFCRENCLLNPGDKVICALSGGADSVALLWSMYLLKDRMNLTLEAAHYNHGLRGAESDRDEDFVRQLCERYEIPLTVGRGEIRKEGRGLEDAARRARYDFFDSLDPDALIATAHTADDNGETLLLRMIRGSGLRGLGGIAPRRGRVIRPMLTVTRKNVEDFLEEWGLHYVEDSSNGTDAFLRNRVRHSVMPLLKAENPRFSANTSRMALTLRQDEEYLDAQAEAALADAWKPGGISCDSLLKLHPAIRSRVLAKFLQKGGLREPEAIHLDGAEKLLRADNPSARLGVPGGVELERCYDLLRFVPESTKIPPTNLCIPGETELPGWKILVTESLFPDNPGKELYSFYAPLGSELWVRSRQTGDVMHRPGGHKSLKKLMIDARIPASSRDAMPLVLCGEEILFAAGVGVSADCVLKPGAAALKIEILKIER